MPITPTVSAVPMSQWSNPTPAPNTYMGSVNINSGASASPSGTTTGGSSSSSGSSSSNSSGNGIISSSSNSSAADNQTMVDAQNMNVNNTDLTNNHNNTIALLQSQMDALEARRKNEIDSINSAFNTKSDQLSQTQKSETGTYTATLARMGGYLGNTASATGALINLNNTHQAQISDLESKRQAAVQAANSAIDDKSFELARMKIQEAKDYTAAIQKSKQDFFNNNKKVIEDQQQSKKDSAIAKLYSEGTTDVTSLLTSLKGLGIYATADDINKTITSLVPPAVSDLVKILDKYGAPGDVKLKVLNSKNVNDAYAAAGVWANLGGDGETGKYNFYKATQQAVGKPFVDPMTFFNQAEILKNEKNKYTTYTGGSGVVGNSLGSAIVAQESGGSYTAVNSYKDNDGIPLEKKVESGDKALGKYQMMPFNLPKYAGIENTKENRLKFLQSPELQDAAFKKMLDELTVTYNGDTNKVLAAYYGGPLGASNVGTPQGDIQGKYDKNGKPTGNPSVNEYVQQVKAKMNPAVEPIGKAVNQILGIGKFTEMQRNDFVNAMNNAQSATDALSILKTKAKDAGLTGTNATKLEAQEQTVNTLMSLQDKLNQYYALGGDTNVFEGTIQNAQNQLLKVQGDPKLVELAVSIEAALQVYRNAISGTAYSNQEGVAIASIFPGITKSNGLNKEIINTRVNDMKKFVDDSYSSILGDSYMQIKDAAKKENQTTEGALQEKEQEATAKLTEMIATMNDEQVSMVSSLKSQGFTSQDIVDAINLAKSQGKLK